VKKRGFVSGKHFNKTGRRGLQSALQVGFVFLMIFRVKS